MNSEAIVEQVRTATTEKVKVAIADLDGVLRGKYLHKSKFLSAVSSGFGFCNVVFGWDLSDLCYDNSAYTGWHTGYPDALARIDLSTYRQVPWDGGVPFFLGDFEDGQGNPLAICPRQLLKRVLNKCAAHGFTPYVGMEFEWFNFKETADSLRERNFAAPRPISPGMFGYSLLRMSQNQPFFNALLDELREFGVPIEGLHTETGPGVIEAAILYSQALEAADRATLFKSAVKEIGQRFGIMPSFMAKWNPRLPGCSGHIHQSLWRDEQNVFFDAQAPQTLSATFKSYIAGVLQALPDLLPLYAPTVNSYKRLVDGYWAPTLVSWGVDNRTVAARVLPSGAKATRLELRVPGADVNPYLAIAASLASGLYGVEKGLTLDHPRTVGSAYAEKSGERLPKDLQAATTRFANSTLARELLGDAFVEHFAKTREWEWEQFQTSVTDWELSRYFEII